MTTTGCVPLSVYCSLYGESEDAVNKRIQRGAWRQGREYHKISGVRERWIDLEAVSRWVRENSLDS